MLEIDALTASIGMNVIFILSLTVILILSGRGLGRGVGANAIPNRGTLSALWSRQTPELLRHQPTSITIQPQEAASTATSSASAALEQPSLSTARNDEPPPKRSKDVVDYSIFLRSNVSSPDAVADFDPATYFSLPDVQDPNSSISSSPASFALLNTLTAFHKSLHNFTAVFFTSTYVINRTIFTRGFDIGLVGHMLSNPSTGIRDAWNTLTEEDKRTVQNDLSSNLYIPAVRLKESQYWLPCYGEDRTFPLEETRGPLAQYAQFLNYSPYFNGGFCRVCILDMLITGPENRNSCIVECKDVRFVDLKNVARSDGRSGEAIAECIWTTLITNNLEPAARLLAQVYDGASNMSSGKVGAWIVIQRLCGGRLVPYIWCTSHSLALVIKDTFKGEKKFLVIPNCLDTLDEVVRFFNNSDTKNDVLKKEIADFKAANNITDGSLVLFQILRLRWAQQHMSIVRFKEYFPAILAALNVVKTTWKKGKMENCPVIKATGLKTFLESMDFLVASDECCQ